MNQEEIIKKVDHTLLHPEATWEQIKEICNQGIKYHTASVCIPPSFVERASQYVKRGIKICTVIGFPNGYSTTKIKMLETENALENGADEIDMVINLGDVKEGRFETVAQEISSLNRLCHEGPYENKILKVIVETCLLTREEKIQMCRIVSQCGADYIKTSTGFSTGGATFEDVELFRQYVEPHVKIKAAGGISSFEDGEKFICLGADRLGTSRLVKILEEGL